MAITKEELGIIVDALNSLNDIQIVQVKTAELKVDSALNKYTNAIGDETDYYNNQLSRALKERSIIMREQRKVESLLNKVLAEYYNNF